MKHRPTSTGARRGLLAACLAALLLAPLFVFGQGAADAQVTDPQTGTTYAVDALVGVDAACPAGTIDRGTFEPPASAPGRLCRPDGFGPLIGLDACQRVSDVFATDYAYSASTGLCGFTGYGAAPGLSCGSLVRLSDLVIARTGIPLDFTGCVSPWLTNSVGIAPVGTPACIESATVQDDAAATGLQVGGTYSGSDGIRYFIQTGPPTCKFNCSDGFDANCDGKFGDFCPVELNLQRVEDVRSCLAHLNPAPAAATDAVASVPAVPAQSVAVPVSALAHTGAEDKLAAVGLIAIAYGAVALAVRRRVVD